MSSPYIHVAGKTDPRQVELDRTMVIEWFARCRGASGPIMTYMVKKAVESGHLLLQVHDDGYHLILSPLAFQELQEAVTSET